MRSVQFMGFEEFVVVVENIAFGKLNMLEFNNMTLVSLQTWRSK